MAHQAPIQCQHAYLPGCLQVESDVCELSLMSPIWNCQEKEVQKLQNKGQGHLKVIWYVRNVTIYDILGVSTLVSFAMELVAKGFPGVREVYIYPYRRTSRIGRAG